MFRGSSILASYEGPSCFTTDCFEDEMDIIELGFGPAIGMINENDLGESHTLEVLKVRGRTAEIHSLTKLFEWRINED